MERDIDLILTEEELELIILMIDVGLLEWRQYATEWEISDDYIEKSIELRQELVDLARFQFLMRRYIIDDEENN